MCFFLCFFLIASLCFCLCLCVFVLLCVYCCCIFVFTASWLPAQMVPIWGQWSCLHRNLQIYLLVCLSLSFCVYICLHAFVLVFCVFVFSASYLARRCQFQDSDLACIGISKERNKDVKQSKLPVDRVPEFGRVVDRNICLWYNIWSQYLPVVQYLITIFDCATIFDHNICLWPSRIALILTRMVKDKVAYFWEEDDMTMMMMTIWLCC